MSLLAPELLETPTGVALPLNSATHQHHLDDNPEPASARLQTYVAEEKRWALILAGGDGPAFAASLN